MLRYEHPEFSGPIERAWRRYSSHSTGKRMLREDLRKAYSGDLDFMFDLLHPRLRSAVSDQDYKSFGVHASFARRLASQ